MDLLSHATFTGPALPEPFVRFELEKELSRRKLLPRPTGDEAKQFRRDWAVYRRGLRELVSQGGPVRVRNHVLAPLVTRLGYASLDAAGDVQTREGLESGGYLFSDGNGRHLRAWSTTFAEDLDAPARRGHAYRFSHARIAQRVLLATGEQVGLLTNGLELRILLSNRAGRDSEISIAIDPAWKRSRDVPDTYRLLLALASPAGLVAVPDLVEKARLQQTRVTKELRLQARQAVTHFVQEVLDHPQNRDRLAVYVDRDRLAHQLWREGLIVVYRLLFILKSEASDDAARAFGFASNSLWRNSYSPSVALAGFARAILDEGAETGRLLEDGLRGLFRMFTTGVQSSELNVRPLGGVLFGPDATPVLADLRWGERAVATLLDRLLWTPQRRGSDARQRVHYGPLDVKDLGRVYEALLELEPGISSQTMYRLRRAKLEVVVPVAQGERYRPANGDSPTTAGRSSRTKVQWIEEIPPGRFYLRAGLGRKASGSFYTPDSFVTFLVQETLGPLVEEVSPQEDPRPLAILSLKVLDDACGSGHFLVESDRFLGDKLYEACRLCDEKALEAERHAEKARNAEEREERLAEAVRWRQRILDLPDPDDELVLYLPSRAPEGEESGLSQRKALALWIESQAEGLPLTFLDHRIVVGDSLTGPFFGHLLTFPGSQRALEDLYSQGLSRRFTAALQDALAHVRDLEASVGISEAETRAKQAAKDRLDRALAPFRVVAAAWAGGVMLGPAHCDDEGYLWLVRQVAETGDLPADLADRARLQTMIARGLGVEAVPVDRDALLALLASGQCIPALSFELTFPEVFYPTGDLVQRRGFDVALGNPPWDTIRRNDDQFFGMIDFEYLDPPTRREKTSIKKRLLSDPEHGKAYSTYISDEKIRLLTTEGEQQDCYVEVAHEALIRGWSRLRGWIETDREGLLTHRRLTETAAEWQASNRDESYLYRGVRLAEAEEWATQHPGELNRLEHDFLGASLAERDRAAAELETQRQRELQQSRRTRNLAMLAFGTAIAALVLAVAVGWFLYQQNRELRAERLVSEGRRLVEDLDAQGAVDKFREAAATNPDLRVDVSSEITNALRYVASELVQEGETLAQAGDYAGADERFRSAAMLNAPPDTPVYVWIEQGFFTMGSSANDSAASSEEMPQPQVWVDRFWIQRSEVTNGQYLRCVEANVCDPPHNDYWDKGQYALLPVTHIDWFQANVYASWTGGRLPTEAEWEKACRGGDGRIYHWGNDPPAPSYVNFKGSGSPMPSKIGSYSPGAHGLYDMSGNVWEWTSSLHWPYPYDPEDGREAQTSSDARVLRGGAYNHDGDTDLGVRCTVRGRGGPSGMGGYYGFRVVSRARPNSDSIAR